MKVIIYGAAGFIGNPLRRHLASLGHEVSSYDNFVRAEQMKEVGSESLTPWDTEGITELDVCDFDGVRASVEKDRPDAIIHLGEQRCAPYSMVSAKNAAFTQRNNLVGTMNILWAMKEVKPDCHLVKLGTAGEYPDWLYKDVLIPEGSRIKVGYGGKEDWEIPVPRYFGSWYHASKMYDSFNIDYACRIWGLRATDLNQGVVYGHSEGTIFDYDHIFGTVVNRMAVQAVAGHPLTVYGEGGQTRGFISLQNALEAITLVMQNPPEGYRVIHQVTETHSIMSIAEKVAALTGAEIRKYPNPRFEMESHTLRFEAKTLKDFGLKQVTLDDTLPGIIETAAAHKENIDKDIILPPNMPKWRREETLAKEKATA